MDGFISLHNRDGFKIDLRYAGSNNFVGRNLYGDFNEAYLHPEAFRKLEAALKMLRSLHPGYGMKIFDALRPRSIQRVLFDFVKGTPQEIYVANPDRGSVHNFGFAVDLTLVDESGQELDMGTPFDDFTLLAQPRHEEQFITEGKLTEEQVGNRRLLREVMEAAGFKGISHEWWHFNAQTLDFLKANHTIVE